MHVQGLPERIGDEGVKMSTINTFQISFEIWGCIIGLITCILTGSVTFEAGDKGGKKLWVIVLINNLLLVSDAMAYIYRGDMTSLGTAITRVSNFSIFALEYVLVGIFVSYVLLIAGRETAPGKIWSIIAYGFLAAGAAGLIITPFTGLYYYFDAANRYCRGSGIALSFATCGAVIAICVLILWRSRRSMNRGEKNTFLILISVFATCLAGQFAFYGFSFINFSITIAFLILHLSSYSRLQEMLTERKVEEAIRDTAALSEWSRNSLSSLEQKSGADYEENKE